MTRQQKNVIIIIIIIIIIIYLFIFIIIIFFIRQSVIVFQEIGKNPKKRNGEGEKEEDRYISWIKLF